MSVQLLLKYFVRLMVLFLITPVHEYAHAWTADKLGDPTAGYKGRLTLNPLAHIDLFGGIMILLVGFGWAKPVPVNPGNFKKPRKGMALTALAGPVANLLVAFVAVILFQIYLNTCYIRIVNSSSNAYYYLYVALNYFIVINLNLAIFNLLPVPPLDGSKILSYFLPPKADRWMYENQQLCYVIMIVLLYTGILSTPITFLSNKLFNIMIWATEWIPSLLS